MECASCHEENLPGADNCSNCDQDLRALDVPRPTVGLQRRLMKTPVGEVYPRAPLQVTPDTPVAKAIRQMQLNSQGCILVVEDGKLEGILTERDLLHKVAGEPVDIETLPVRDLMTEKPVTLRKNDTLASAMNRLSVGGYRHLPILTKKNGELLGFLSIRCMLKYIADQVT